MEECRVVKWWDWFWGAVWMVGSVAVAYLTARWFAENASPADLGGLRYGLIAFSGLFGLLVGAFVLSLTVIGITSGVEWLLARAGHPLRPPASSPLAIAPDPPESAEVSVPEEATDTVPAKALKALGSD
jgi:hypothetical protein